MDIIKEWETQAAHFTEKVGKNLPEPGKRSVLVTSALPYVNNVPHLGNIIGCVLSGDVFTRYCRMMEYNVLHVSGTDEYGTATEMKALQEKVSPQQICNKYHQLHKQIYADFNIAFDYFGRTSTENQKEIVQDVFTKLHSNGYTSTDTNAQLYCVKCEKFLADRFVYGTCPDTACAFDDARGDQCERCGRLLDADQLVEPKCRLCSAPPKWRKSEHIYIELPKLEAAVKTHFDKVANAKDSRWSQNAVSIASTWFRQGLKKRCITRDLKWGVSVPLEGFKDKVFYVWFDAPIGYLSLTKSLLGEDWKKWWQNEDVELYQFVGKDNVVFHGVLFPACQIGTGDPFTLVRHLCATEYLRYEGQKFSKSRGTGVFGDAIASTSIPADVWRFYLLYIRPESQDSTFAWDDFAMKVNSELLANLGNFINRALRFVVINFDSAIPAIKLVDADVELIKAINEELEAYYQHMEKVQMRDALQRVLAISRLGNKYMQDNEPWVLVKKEDTRARAATVVGIAANISLLLAALLYPFMPAVSATIRKQCNMSKPYAMPQRFTQFISTGTKIGDVSLRD